MAVEFLGTFATFEVNGQIVLLTQEQCDAIEAMLTADPANSLGGKVSAIKYVREHHRSSLRDSKDLVDFLFAKSR